MMTIQWNEGNEVNSINVEDTIVQEVILNFAQRSNVGIKKYNNFMTRTDLTFKEWVNHAKEEAMDFSLYLNRILRDIDDEK